MTDGIQLGYKQGYPCRQKYSKYVSQAAGFSEDLKYLEAHGIFD